MPSVILPVLLTILCLVPGSAGAPVMRLKLKDGKVYLLKEPPTIDGTRYVFHTLDGKVYSLDQSEVASIGPEPLPTRARAKLDPQDSRALGAITRQQRERRGKSADVAPRTPHTTRKPTRKPKATPTPRPSLSPPNTVTTPAN